MSVLIRGMEMPISCYKCSLRRRDGMDIVCPVAHERFSVADVNILEYRLDNCPLVSIPSHGRLIDADALIEKVIAKYLEHEREGELVFAAVEVKQDIVDLISDAPTIIPAEEGET